MCEVHRAVSEHRAVLIHFLLIELKNPTPWFLVFFDAVMHDAVMQ